MYQFSGFSGNSHIVMRLSIPQKHTVSLTGNTGNFGLWQESLNSGAHKVSLEYRATAKQYTLFPKKYNGDSEINGKTEL